MVTCLSSLEKHSRSLRLSLRMTKIYEAIDKLSRVSGTLQEYEALYIMLRNLSRRELEDAVSKHNLLDIFGHIDLGNRFDFSL